MSTPDSPSLSRPNPLLELAALGQSVWLDFIRRSLLDSGELARLVAEDGIRGVTSNPAIFEKAIGAGDEYTRADPRGRRPASAATRGGSSRRSRSRTSAAPPTCCAGVHAASGGADGFVSLEVAPDLADDAEATVAEARRLWAAVDRPNLMIKVPGTAAGVPGGPPAARRRHPRQRHAAVLACAPTREVAEAHLAALEERGRARRGGRPGGERRELLRQPHRHAGRPLARGARGGGRGRDPRPPARAARPGGDRQRQARLPPLPRAGRRRALACARGARRAAAAAALGLDLDQEPELSRHALRRGADRTRHGRHHAAGDDRRIPRSRRRARRRSARASPRPRRRSPSSRRSASRSTRATDELLADGLAKFVEPYRKLLDVGRGRARASSRAGGA